MSKRYCCRICSAIDRRGPSGTYWTAEFIYWASDPVSQEALAELHQDLARLRQSEAGAS